MSFASPPPPPMTPKTPASKKTFAQCRFIPPRSPLDAELASFLLFSPGPKKETTDDAASNAGASSSSANNSTTNSSFRQPRLSEYDATLKEQLLPGCTSGQTVLGFHASPAPLTDSPVCIAAADSKKRKTTRVIPKFPDKILDAPDLVDDFYLNLLDWSRSNVLAVALDHSVFLWNASTGVTQKLMETSEQWDVITSLSWSQTDKDVLAVGINNGEVQLWDTIKGRKTKSFVNHVSRVGSLSWNESVLSSGSRDSMIYNNDVRTSVQKTTCMAGHQQEVCGLRWSPNGLQLASGGNDNLLNIWDVRTTTPRYTMNHHEAAVKALAWCPFQTNLLASGGGTADRKIRFWNTGNGSCLGEVDTKSQVCALQWSVHDRELVSSHGFTYNQLILWKYEGHGRVTKIAEMAGHRSRVLYLALSPDGTTVVSGAADETLRFWRIFGSPNRTPAKVKAESQMRDMMGFNLIR